VERDCSNNEHTKIIYNENVNIYRSVRRLSTTIFAQLKVVDIPPVMHSNTTTVEIHRVTLADTATVLDIDAFFRPGWWIKIASGSYLLADGKKYMIRGGEGIKIDSLFWMPPQVKLRSG